MVPGKNLFSPRDKKLPYTAERSSGRGQRWETSDRASGIKRFMVVSGALSLGPTYHGHSLAPSIPWSSYLASVTLSRLLTRLFFSFHSRLTTLLAEPSTVSYFTVKIVEYSFRARGCRSCSFTRRKCSQSPPPLMFLLFLQSFFIL